MIMVNSRAWFPKLKTHFKEKRSMSTESNTEKRKPGRPRYKAPEPVIEPEQEVEVPESRVEQEAESVETPPVFTPMDTEKLAVAAVFAEYQATVKAKVDGDVAQLQVEGSNLAMDAGMFRKLFKPVPAKEAPAAPPVQGKWAITIHTPGAVPAQFKKSNGTFSLAAMADWLDANPEHPKAGIAGCMIGCRA
jgi:hypothetical protein